MNNNPAAPRKRTVTRSVVACVFAVAAVLGWVALGDWHAPGIRVLGVYRERWFVLNVCISYLAFWVVLFAVFPPARKTVFKVVAMTLSLGVLVILLELMAILQLVDFRTVLLGKTITADVEHNLRRATPPHTRWEGSVRPDLCTRLGIPGEFEEVVFSTDRFGLRNPPGKKDPEVLVLGDSIVAGMPVAVEGILSERLQKHLGKEVMAVGEAGYAPQESLGRLNATKISVSGKLVLHLIFEGNDLMDSARWRAWVKHKSTAGWPKSGLLGALFSFLKMPNPTVAEHRWGWVTPVGGKREKVYFLYDQRLIDQFAAEFPHLAKALSGARNRVAKLGGTYAVVLIPAKIRALHRHGDWPPHSDFAGGDLWDSCLPELLRTYCHKEGIPFFDCTEALVACLAKGQLPFLPLDTHLTLFGHDAVGKYLAACVQQLGR